MWSQTSCRDGPNWSISASCTHGLLRVKTDLRHGDCFTRSMPAWGNAKQGVPTGRDNSRHQIALVEASTVADGGSLHASKHRADQCNSQRGRDDVNVHTTAACNQVGKVVLRQGSKREFKVELRINCQPWVERLHAESRSMRTNLCAIAISHPNHIGFSGRADPSAYERDW